MKKIVVCVDLNQLSIETLKRLPEIINLEHTKVHFVHVFENLLYDNDLAPFSFPLPSQDIELEKMALSALNRLAFEMDLNPNNIIKKCFFSVSRTEKIKNYLDEIGADLVVVATRNRHGVSGLFSSSLADFLCKFSPCNILVLRPAASGKNSQVK